MKEYNFTLLGQIPAKKNAWKMGRYGIYQSKQKELDALIWQIKEQTINISPLPIKNECSLILRLWQSDRTDLDGQITSICDLLQNAGIVLNDRQIKHIQAEKVVENKNPKVEIIIK